MLNQREEMIVKLSHMKGSEFAASLIKQYSRKGALSDKQWWWVEKLTNPDKDATPVNAGPIIDLLQYAKVKRPVFRAEGLQFSLAPSHGRNAGAVYVKAQGEYQGKIMGGTFKPASDCYDDTGAKVAKIAKDPRGAAVQYGRDTGICACCGRTLTDPKSIELGIGPICADTWGL